MGLPSETDRRSDDKENPLHLHYRHSPTNASQVSEGQAQVRNEYIHNYVTYTQRGPIKIQTEHNGPWSAAAPPRRGMRYRPTAFLRHFRLTALSFRKGKPRSVSRTVFSSLFFFTWSHPQSPLCNAHRMQRFWASLHAVHTTGHYPETVKKTTHCCSLLWMSSTQCKPQEFLLRYECRPWTSRTYARNSSAQLAPREPTPNQFIPVDGQSYAIHTFRDYTNVTFPCRLRLSALLL